MTSDDGGYLQVLTRPEGATGLVSPTAREHEKARAADQPRAGLSNLSYRRKCSKRGAIKRARS
jgi:hypothetical protein